MKERPRDAATPMRGTKASPKIIIIGFFIVLAGAVIVIDIIFTVPS